MKARVTLPLTAVLFGLLVSALTPRPAHTRPRALPASSVPAPSSCDDMPAKSRRYKKFLDNFKGDVEQQKVAYEAGKEYISRYGGCPAESDRKVSAYISKWLEKYEEAVREYERRVREN